MIVFDNGKFELKGAPLKNGVLSIEFEDIGLALPDGSEALRNNEGFSIRLANDIEFRNGVNQLGSWEL